LSDDDLTINYLKSGNAIFLKFWYLQHNPVYKISALPGWKEGVSGTVIGGYNVGINKYSNECKKSAAVEFVKFVTSRDVQKEHIIKNHFFSGITSLYDEEDVCKIIDCDVIKSIQPFSVINLNHGEYDIDYYYKKYRNFFYEFIYEDQPISKVIKKVDDMTKYYHLSIKSDDSCIGLIILIFFFIFMLTFLLSLLLIFVKKLRVKFQFLPYDFWVLSISGSFIYMCSILTFYGKLTNLKCQLRMIFFSFGFILSLLPVLYILIIHYQNNLISKWIKQNRHKFLSVFISIVLLLNLLLLISPYDIVNIIVLNGENFQKCEIHSALGKNLILFMALLNCIIIISILILIYKEWNISATYYYTRFLVTSTVMDIFSLILFGIFNNIEINNYIAYYSILACNIYAFSISNYIFIFGVRLISQPNFYENLELKERFIKSNKSDTSSYSKNSDLSIEISKH